MDEGGTGGSLFRNIYRDFLKECDEVYPDMGIHEAYLKFAQIAPLWRDVSKSICRTGEDSNEGLLKEASHIFNKDNIEKFLHEVEERLDLMV